jgi:hypothetical protein
MFSSVRGEDLPMSQFNPSYYVTYLCVCVCVCVCEAIVTKGRCHTFGQLDVFSVWLFNDTLGASYTCCVVSE